MATVTGSTPYTVTSSTATITGATPYTVVASTRRYPLQQRVGNTLEPRRLGKRRGTVIDWLTQDLAANTQVVGTYETATYDNGLYG